MSQLPQYAKKRFIAGNKFVTSLNNPYRKMTQKTRVFQLEDKSYDLNRPDVLGIPYIYTVREIELQTYGEMEEETINIFTFETEEW